MSKKEIELDKETVLRNIRQVYRIVYGGSELLAPIPDSNSCNSSVGISNAGQCTPTSVETVEKLTKALDKQNVRFQVLQVIMEWRLNEHKITVTLYFLNLGKSGTI